MISPLLANVYLNLFDRMFRSYCRATGTAAELIRYADDFVIVMRGRVERTRQQVEQMLEGLALKLNADKTRVLDARQQSFEFLGFSFRRQRSSKSGKMIALVEPSRKSEQRFRDEVRSLTARWTTLCAATRRGATGQSVCAGMGKLLSPAQQHPGVYPPAILSRATDAQVPAEAQANTGAMA